MKKIAIVSLIAFICWLYPINLLAQKTDNPQTETKTEEVTSVRNDTQPKVANQNSSQSGPPRKSSLQLPTPQQSYNGRYYSKEEVQQLIRDYSAVYGINPEVPLCIARLESGFNQFSKNKNSTASGVFQYLSGTWRGTDEGKVGYSVFDADANVKAAVKYMASRQNTKPWVVGPRCPQL